MHIHTHTLVHTQTHPVYVGQVSSFSTNCTFETNIMKQYTAYIYVLKTSVLFHCVIKNQNVPFLFLFTFIFFFLRIPRITFGYYKIGFHPCPFICWFVCIFPATFSWILVEKKEATVFWVNIYTLLKCLQLISMIIMLTLLGTNIFYI